jgi:hypothetical protein
MDAGVNDGFDKLDKLLAKGPEMTSAPKSPAQRHADDAARFTELVESASAGDWARPSPVAGWTGLDIVKHLVEWSRGFLTGAGIELPPLDVEADPVATWKQHVTDIQAILDDPAGRVLSNPHTGDKPVDDAIDQFYTADVWMHSWDQGARSRARPGPGALQRRAGGHGADGAATARQRAVRSRRARRPQRLPAGQADRLHRPRPGLATRRWVVTSGRLSSPQ